MTIDALAVRNLPDQSQQQQQQQQRSCCNRMYTLV